MDDPVKIIHKYKNNNGRIQYHIHIFLGDLIDENCMKILRKIIDFDLYSSLTNLEDREIDILEKNYGEFWYEKFFNSYHINNTKEITQNNATRMKELRSIYGDSWVKKHFVDYRKRLESVTYSYEFTVKEEKERKMITKLMKRQMGRQSTEAEEIIDYTTLGKPLYVSETDSEPTSETDQVGGKEYDAADADLEEATTSEFDFENLENQQDITLFENEVEKDLENVDIVYGEIDETDKEIKTTTREIKNAITNETYEKLNRKMVEFDNSKDNNMFDENLKDVFNKNYITHQYIYKDDTIKVISNKICCGFKNNSKFGEDTYIIPSYQYLWSEYYYERKIDKVMIGQKWIIKNDLLQLDVEPNQNLGIYEDLRGNLRTLRDNIRRQGKIKREDDDNSILMDYQGFYTYNELYMIDIYNELGSNYDPSFEELKNLIDVYLKIYFPRIRPDDVKNIIEFINTDASESKRGPEKNKLKMIFETLNNDLILENEIMRDIEYVKKRNAEYVKIFQENFVTQSVIRSYLTDRYKKVDLFRIFDNFILDENYPFIQYQPLDGVSRYRYNEKYLLQNERKEIIMKWFENSPYGISFKVRVSDRSDYKYMAINLSDNGRIDYKIQWKEEDMSTVSDIGKTYKYIRRLVEKINKENEKFYIRLNIPSDENFKFAFINTIQKFELPDNFTINHNDLSEFSRYFFPYIALVIEPRKRQSKTKKDILGEKSKFGTYLRYKRISKYENKTKIEHRIIFFMRNYEYNDKSLANEISKEFNITEEQAFNEIETIRNKYPNMKKSRKVLKKLENIPKYKPPGIGIDIQGKKRNKYKMRISGARDKEQLDRIITFMNILIYLYIETYLYKKPDKQKTKERLKHLTKIAKRRNKVDEIVYHDAPIRSVKQMAAIDKKRLSYKAEEDQNQWTRNCQNSGDDKKRRPQQFLNVEELLKLGFVWKDKLDGEEYGHYERTVVVDKDGNADSKKKKKEVVLKAVKLPLDDSGDNFVYYTCGPEENGKHMYIGFLNKSKNPYGEAMPCCFIKDQLTSRNIDKRNFFLKSIGITGEEKDPNKITGDQLYILQDSNKVQEGRFVYLPRYLDIFMNLMLGNECRIKNHYLISTSTGYYFKYGAKQDEFKYLNALSAIYDTSVNEIKDKLVKVIELDTHQTIFTSLNNGDIRTQFGSKEAYIAYIKNNEYLEYPLLNDLLSIPGVIRDQGINIVIFKKKTIIIKRKLEKEKVKENYYIACSNIENVNDIKDPKRETAFVIKESKNYYPIILVTKPDEQSKTVDTIKTFQYNNTPKNIVNHVINYYRINCQSEFKVLVKDKFSVNFNAKETNEILVSLGKKEYRPKTQIIDARFKCRYLITYGKHIIPTIISGTLYHTNISTNVDSYVQDYDTTYKYLNEIYNLTNTKLKIRPVGIYYKQKTEKSYIVTAIMTEGYDSVPIIEKSMTIEYVKNHKLYVQSRPNDNVIDAEIIKGKKNIVVDDRVYAVSKEKYETELYQLFRYHMSYYLNNVATGLKYKELLENIINQKKVDKKVKKVEIKKLIYQMISNNLAKTFVELLKKVNLIEQTGGEEYLNPLTQAITPVSTLKQKEETIQIIPDYSDMSDRKLNDPYDAEISDELEFDYKSQMTLPNSSMKFSKNEAPQLKDIKFPENEKNWINVMSVDKTIDYPSFILHNNRELCYNNTTKDSCNRYQHCNWINSRNMCMLGVKEDLLIDFVNKITEEFFQNELRAQEILRKGEYFVSNIVDYNVFTERSGEKIVLSSGTNINKILGEIFGKENIPHIGKRRNKLDAVQKYDQLNLDNPIKEIGKWHIQNIIDNNNTIFRAFANAYYWLRHPHSNVMVRNLGYYSLIQTDLANLYKSQVIDWLREDHEEIKHILPHVGYKNILDFIIKLSSEAYTFTDGLGELYVLSKIYKMIIYIHDDNYNMIYTINPQQGIISGGTQPNKQTKKSINFKFKYSRDMIPEKVEVMYSNIS